MGEPAHRLVHLDGGANGPIGVVLVRHRCAEQRDDPVAEDFVDRTAELRDVGDQPLERSVDQPLHPLRVEVLRQRRVADEVGEHHRHHASLLGGDRHHLLAT